MSRLAAAVLTAAGLVVAWCRPTALDRLSPVTRQPARWAATAGAHGPVAVAALAGLVVAVVLGGPSPVLAGLGLLAGAGVAHAAGRHREALARAAARESLPGVCRLLTAELRAGTPPGPALAAAAATAPPLLGGVLRRAASADGFGLDAAAELARSPDTAGLAAVWHAGRRSGAALADATERLAEALAAAVALRRDVDAALAGPRASATLLALLPLAGLGLSVAAGAAPARFFLRSPPGVGCLVAGVGLDLAGLWWTRRIVRAAVR